jgi:glucokinase
MFGGHGAVKDLIYLTCSTGMGGGIVTNGELIQGVTDTGGEVGHHVLDPNGPVCACGQRGCWEAYVGGRTLAERVKAELRAGHIKSAIVEKAGGELDKVDMLAIELAARDGDPLAVKIWEEFTERLAQGIGNLIMILNPEIVVLGTMAIKGGDFYLEPIRRKLPKYAWRWPLAACRVVPSALGSKIGDLAALAVALSALRHPNAQSPHGGGVARH